MQGQPQKLEVVKPKDVRVLRVPLGYQLYHLDGRIYLVRKMPAAALIHRLFLMADSQLSHEQIANFLNIEGRTTLAGGAWSVWTIRTILACPLYAALTPELEEAGNPSLVLRERWLRINGLPPMPGPDLGEGIPRWQFIVYQEIKDYLHYFNFHCGTPSYHPI
jgi:hypothetical protein